MEILLLLAKVILSTILLLLISFAIGIQVLRYYALKLYMDLPWLKWLTLADAKKLAPEFVCRICLPLYYERNELEVRELTGLDDTETRFVEIMGFSPPTVHSYEFRRTKRGGRKPRFTLKDLMAGLKPATVPAR